MIKTSMQQAGLDVVDYCDQGNFLRKYGIQTRLRELLSRYSGEQHKALRQKLLGGANILLNPSKMGTIYKTILAKAVNFHGD